MITRKIRLRTRIDRLLSIWFYFSMRHAVAVIAFSILAATAAVNYTIHNLRINTYPGNVLSDELPWRQDKLAYERAFPQFRDAIVIVLDAPTPDQARDAAARLYHRLREDSVHFEWVFYPPESGFFRENGLLFDDAADLEKLSDHLAKVQPFLAEVSADRSLRGVFSLLERALRTGEDKDIDFATVFDRIASALRGYLDGSGTPLSWIELMAGEDAKPADRRVLLEVMPRIEYSSLAPGENLMATIRQTGKALRLEESGVLMRLTGAAALSVDELKSASIGAQMASLGSFLGVSLVMLIGLRSLWLVLAVQIGLVLGLIFTAAFAAVALGQLNLISVAFSVMYIGIGADYAIYLSLRYRELACRSHSHRSALKRAVRHVGGSLEIGTLTTAIGFFCFVPTSYRGVAELGIISGAGMFISLLVTLAILPAFLGLRRPSRYLGPHAGHAEPPRWQRNFLTFPLRHSRSVLVAAAIVAALAFVQLKSARFDQNPLNLQDPSAESVRTFRELLADGSHSPWFLAALAKDGEEAAAMKQRLERLPVVDKVLTLEDFVPGDQDEKLDLIDQMALTLGPQPASGDTKPRPAPDEEAAAVRRFLATLTAHLSVHPDAADAPAGFRLAAEQARLAERIQSAQGETRTEAVERVSHTLVGGLGSQLARLVDALKARRVGIGDLPDDFRSRWITKDGVQRVEIRPKEDLHDPQAMRRFVDQVRQVVPHATGVPVLFLESSDAVVTAFLQAFAYAIVAITVILFLTMEKKIDVLLVLLPLLLASLLTGAAMALAKVPFNFANIIALPLVFGMGVDNCIHMVHRFRTAPPKDGILLHTSTALAVVLSALTNISGFGNLAVSPHLGMASMGIMLSIGILATLLCSMIVLPALLAQTEDWGRLKRSPCDRRGEEIPGLE
ncbi:MMPL family transporter [Methylococcus geothermalis]|uniref:MMPL family transporter n=1 Tax=Methylococcus geothermalis TaxID=2681310 RepID=A0A858Q437_9GAMM|nr:MMPL family transporter [Methylococcus geothermalis]QJD28578.1 MMPL family transporter [Methylococcus geothermalis]